MKKTFYITGTDTDAGKTWVSSECLKALCHLGINAVGMKPVASGCELTSEGLRNDDALKLIAASSTALPYELINPIALGEPTAPEIAAKHDGVIITLEPVLSAYQQIKIQADNSIAELNKMKALDKNKDFLEAAKALFKFYSRSKCSII